MLVGTTLDREQLTQPEELHQKTDSLAIVYAFCSFPGSSFSGSFNFRISYPFSRMEDFCSSCSFLFGHYGTRTIP